MDYGQILSRSWRITWENKFLWVLGFLAALTRASSNFNSSSNYSETGPESIEQIVQASALLIGLCCIVFIIGIALWLLSLAARGGLISAVSQIDNGEIVTLGGAFRAGTERIMSLVGMSLILYLPLILVVFVVAVGFGFFIAGSVGGTAVFMEDSAAAMEEVFAAGIGLMVLCLCGLMCVFMLVGVVINFINAFAFRGVMLRGLGAIEAISHGWQVFRNNVGEVLLLSLLFLGITILYGFAAAIVMIPASLVLFVPLLGTAFAGGSMGGLEMLMLAGGGLCLGLLGAVLYSILTTWQSAAFTLAYDEWTNKEKELKVV
ncbi:MAG: hypothetical protein GY796_36280 [Chloroflexi bacterium]|nr:hypothetical protein [Chloroflexota bacterium]